MTFQRDKLLHLAVGLTVACATYGLTYSLFWTWGVTIVVAGLKEAIDATERGHVEFRDFIATILPACVPTIFVQAGISLAIP